MFHYYVIIMLAALLAGLPLGIAIFASSWCYATYIRPIPLTIIPQAAVNILNNWVLLAVPLYILMGGMMMHTGITRRLTDFAINLVSPLRGALAHASIVTGVFMAGVSGAATADAAALGAVFIPSMRQSGYSASFAACVVGCAAIIGPIIPPSIPMVVYGSLANVSVGRLFLAGVVPGLLMGGYLMLTTQIITRRRGYAPARPFHWPSVQRSFFSTLPALSIPLIIVLGLVVGLFTPTESGIMAVLASILVGVLAYRELTLRGIIQAGRETIVTMGAVSLVVGACAVFGKLFILEGGGQQIGALLLKISGGRIWLLLLCLNVLLLILGMFMESLSILILITPVLVPVFTSLGVDPVHLGLVIILNLMIGMLTPPVGIVMFLVVGMANITIKEFLREFWPFLIALMIVLFLVTYIPAVSLWLPNLVMPNK